jgi:transmembrane 9 superfamily protein 2/4
MGGNWFMQMYLDLQKGFQTSFTCRFNILSVLLGSGAQILAMACITMIFAIFGFLGPANRGSLMTTSLVLFVLCGFFAGFASASFYRMFGGENARSNILWSSFLVPGCVFTVFLIINFFLIGDQSSGAVPFGTIFGLMAMWFLVSIPLCVLGSYFAYSRRPKMEAPIRTNQIPRQIPVQPYYLTRIPSFLMSGILPFGAIFIELYFITNSLWAHEVYYVFGFLFIIGIILVMTVAEVSILLCYFQLCSENYHWYWRSFVNSGMCDSVDFRLRWILCVSVFNFLLHNKISWR